MADKNDIRASDGLVVNQAPVGLGQPAGIADAGQSLDELRTDLKARFGARGTPSQWAAKHGVSDENILAVLSGRREPGPKLLGLLGYEREIIYRRVGDCPCFTCAKAAAAADPMPADYCDYRLMRMFLCETCGNKRCPHAANHRYACTNSNEPGQDGSLYSRYPAQATTPDKEG